MTKARDEPDTAGTSRTLAHAPSPPCGGEARLRKVNRRLQSRFLRVGLKSEPRSDSTLVPQVGERGKGQVHKGPVLPPVLTLR